MKYYLSKKEIKKTNTYVRVSGIFYLFSILICFFWTLFHLNINSVFEAMLSISFFISLSTAMITTVITVINNWDFYMPYPSKIKIGEEPTVAVIIPTYGEPFEIIVNTIESVLNQNYPSDKLIVFVSDDSSNELLEEWVINRKKTANIIYHVPPKIGDPKRNGEAKAGNLNSIFNLIKNKFPHVNYLETRDADDLVGSRNFLRYCLKPLMKDNELAFVQTIKQCKVSHGDPFSNTERIFYERIMPARCSVNATFPCGSGLVWNIKELGKIGGFPKWNLVEDLQSGYEILKIGGKGIYLPIIGTIGQISPEDVPNFYKQRSTWAIDTIRLFYWKNPFSSKYLTWKQKLQFFELKFSYLMSFSIIIFILNIIISLSFSIYPISASPIKYLIYFGTLTISMEAYNIVKARGLSYHDQWRSRQLQIGLSPIFIVSAIKALLYGPNRKPKYIVTKKSNVYGFYWKQVLPQIVLFISLCTAVTINIFFVKKRLVSDKLIIFWAIFFATNLSQIIKNSWFGYDNKINFPTFNLKLISQRVYDAYNTYNSK